MAILSQNHHNKFIYKTKITFFKFCIVWHCVIGCLSLCHCPSCKQVIVVKKTPASAASGYFDCYLEVFLYLVVFIFSHLYDTFLDSYLFMSRKKLFYNPRLM